MCHMAIEKYSKANSIIEEIADRTQDFGKTYENTQK